MQTLEEALETLTFILDETPAIIRSIPQEDYVHKASPTKWSKQELLGHLADSAYNNIQRFVRAQYEELPIISYNQDEWVALNHYQSYDREALLNLWASLNRHIIHIISSAYKTSLQRMSKTSVDGEPRSIEWLYIDYVKHLQYHMGQILPNYERKVEHYG